MASGTGVPSVPWQPKSQLCHGVHQAHHGQLVGEGTVPLCTALVQPHREHWVQLVVPQHTKDIRLLECVQGRATEMGKGLEGKT